MSRLAFPRLFLSALFFLLPVLAPAAARSGEVAVVLSGSAAELRSALEGFRDNLPGQKIKVYNLEGAAGEQEPFFESLAKGRPSLVFTVGPEASVAARRYVDDVPVVFAMARHAPPETNLKSGNMTGVSNWLSPERMLSLLKIFLPDLGKVGAIFNPANTGGLVREAAAKCAEAGIELLRSRVDSEEDVGRAFRPFRVGIDLFWLFPDPTINTPKAVREVLKFTLRNKVPMIVHNSLYVRAGALLSVEPDSRGMGEQAAELAKRIIAGESPSSIEIEHPKKIALGVNLRTARLIGRVKDVVVNSLVYAVENKLDVMVVK